MCDKHSVPQDLRSGIVSESRTLQEAGARILDYIGKTSEEQMVKNPHNFALGVSEKDSKREGLKNALLHRCDASKPLNENGKRFRSCHITYLELRYPNSMMGKPFLESSQQDDKYSDLIKSLGY